MSRRRNEKRPPPRASQNGQPEGGCGLPRAGVWRAGAAPAPHVPAPQRQKRGRIEAGRAGGGQKRGQGAAAPHPRHSESASARPWRGWRRGPPFPRSGREWTRSAGAPPGLDGGEMVVVGIEQRLRRLDGRGRQRLALRASGASKCPRSAGRPPRKPLGLLVEVAVETSAPCGVEIGLAHEECRRSTGWRAALDRTSCMASASTGSWASRSRSASTAASRSPMRLRCLRDQRGRSPENPLPPDRSIPVGLGPAATALAQPVGGGLKRVVKWWRRRRPTDTPGSTPSARASSIRSLPPILLRLCSIRLR